MYSGTTTHYNLPQYAANDVPSILGDLNTAYEDIDTAIYGVASSAATAETKANTALESAGVAVTTAQSAQADATQALTDVAQAQSDATQALADAQSAGTAAASALTTAQSASSTAQSASNTAQSAATDATAALNAVSQASSDAATALATANSANTTAGNAMTTAGAAQSAAASASTAVTALDTRVTALEQTGGDSMVILRRNEYIADLVGVTCNKTTTAIRGSIIGLWFYVSLLGTFGNETISVTFGSDNTRGVAQRINDVLVANDITDLICPTAGLAPVATAYQSSDNAYATHKTYSLSSGAGANGTINYDIKGTCGGLQIAIPLIATPATP